jgi:hypothetical protein
MNIVDMEIIFIIIIAVAVLLSLAIVLQIIYIQIKLVHFEKDMSKDVTILNPEHNYLSIYAIKVNREMCFIMNKMASEHFTTFESMISNSYDDVILPYICNGTIKNVDVRLKRKGLLSLEQNDSSVRMAEDCIDNNLHYIIINEVVFKIIYDEALNQSIKKFCTEKNIDNNVQSSYTFTLYSIADHMALSNRTDCTFKVSSFMGTFKSVGAINNIEIMDVLGDLTTAHVVGYRV